MYTDDYMEGEKKYMRDFDREDLDRKEWDDEGFNIEELDDSREKSYIYYDREEKEYDKYDKYEKASKWDKCSSDKYYDREEKEYDKYDKCEKDSKWDKCSSDKYYDMEEKEYDKHDKCEKDSKWDKCSSDKYYDREGKEYDKCGKDSKWDKCSSDKYYDKEDDEYDKHDKCEKINKCDKCSNGDKPDKKKDLVCNCDRKLVDGDGKKFNALTAASPIDFYIYLNDVCVNSLFGLEVEVYFTPDPCDAKENPEKYPSCSKYLAARVCKAVDVAKLCKCHKIKGCCDIKVPFEDVVVLVTCCYKGKFEFKVNGNYLKCPYRMNPCPPKDK